MPSPQIAAIPVDSFPPQPGVEPITPELPLEQRWREPFAASVTGSTTPHTSGEVVVLDAGMRGPAFASSEIASPELSEQPAPETRDQPDPAAEVEEPVFVVDDSEDVDSLAVADPGAVAAAPPVGGAAPATSGASAGDRDADVPSTYTIQTGDTWYGIARQFGVTVNALAAINPSIDTERIQAGQIIQIPELNPATVRSETVYIVSPGDTLWSIARRHGVSVDVLRRINNLTDDRIRVGQEIRVPEGE